MRSFALVFVAGTMLACASWEPPPDGARLAGPFPQDYQKRILAHLDERLFDSETARVRWGESPALMWGWLNPDGIGRRYYGWGVCFKINAKNRFGGYVGYTPYFALLTPEVTLADEAPGAIRPVNGCTWRVESARP